MITIKLSKKILCCHRPPSVLGASSPSDNSRGCLPVRERKARIAWTSFVETLRLDLLLRALSFDMKYKIRIAVVKFVVKSQPESRKSGNLFTRTCGALKER